MNSNTSIALSGLRSATLSMDAAAHNIANAQTPGFRREQVAVQTQAEGGVTATLSQAALAVEMTGETAGDLGGDDLAGDIVQEMAASYAFKANVFSLKTGLGMLGSLLDLQA